MSSQRSPSPSRIPRLVKTTSTSNLAVSSSDSKKGSVAAQGISRAGVSNSSSGVSTRRMSSATSSPALNDMETPVKLSNLNSKRSLRSAVSVDVIPKVMKMSKPVATAVSIRSTSTLSVPKMSGFKRLQELAKAEARDKIELVVLDDGEENDKNVVSWTDRYCPTKLAEHFVHKKKIEEFSDWLQSCTKKSSRVKIIDFICQN